MESQEYWINKDLAYEIYENMLKKESCLMPFHAKGPQLSYRRHLVDWITVAIERFKLGTEILHLSVYLLDYFMDNHNSTDKEIQLLACCCILIAAKSEAIDYQIPRIFDLNRFTCWQYSHEEFLRMELMILDFFKWDILMPTAAHYFDLYKGDFGCLDNEDAEATKFSNYYSIYFLQISLQDQRFVPFKPSIVAAACILASRIVLKLIPPWPSYLQKKIYYKLEDLYPCAAIMFQNLEAANKMTKSRKEPKILKDSSPQSS